MANTDSAGGAFIVVGSFFFSDGTNSSQTRAVNLLSGQSQAVVFDEMRAKNMTNYNYAVTPSTKVVSQIVQEQVPVTFVAEKVEWVTHQ